VSKYSLLLKEERDFCMFKHVAVLTCAKHFSKFAISFAGAFRL